jgi:hypothetical protein
MVSITFHAMSVLLRREPLWYLMDWIRVGPYAEQKIPKPAGDRTTVSKPISSLYSN